jgi:hypothetical protein
MRAVLWIMVLLGVVGALVLSTTQGDTLLGGGSDSGSQGAAKQPGGVVARALSLGDRQRVDDLARSAVLELTSDPDLTSVSLRRALAADEPEAQVGKALSQGGSSVSVRGDLAVVCTHAGPVLCAAVSVLGTRGDGLGAQLVTAQRRAVRAARRR